MENKIKRVELITVISAAVIAWILFTMLHEIVGHGLSSIILGEKLMGAVSTTVHIYDFNDLNNVSDRIGWWGFRFVASAGTIVNILTGILALILLSSGRTKSETFRLFLWFFASISIFQQAFWMAVMPFAALGGDWTAFFIGISHPLLWKTGITFLGFALLGLGYYLPLKLWKPNFGDDWTVTKPKVRKITWIPILAAFIILYLSVLGSPLSGPRHTTIVVIFSFIPMLLWLLLVNSIKKPWINSSSNATVLKISYSWIIVAVVLSVFFILILGTGIGSFEGHPDFP